MKLSEKLWSDLKTDEERAAWLRLGRGYETGVVAIAIQQELAMAYERLVGYKNAIAEEREACVQIIEEYRIPVGNSAAGELACEWTYAALKEIRDDIRARGEK